MILQSYAAGRWVPGAGNRKPLLSAVTGEPVAEIGSGGLDYAGMLHHARTFGGPALRAMTFHERALRLKELAKYLMDCKEEFYALSTATGRDPNGLLDRHRGRHRHSVHLLGKGTARAAQRALVHRWPRRTTFQGGNLHRSAHLHAIAGGGHPHQRVQFPLLGHAGEAGTHTARGGPSHRQAGQPDGLPGRAHVPAHDRVRHISRGCSAVHCRRRGRPAGSRGLPGRRDVHGLGGYRPPAKTAAGNHYERCALHHGGRLPELLRSRCGRRTRLGGVRPVREGSGSRDDGQGRPEVHGNTPRHRPESECGSRSRRSVATAGKHGGRQPRDRGGAHGAAR